ncbi:MAG: hypothetical protein Q8N05_15075 [Bacteroidota bacterium]|nr:hypothetical protein [Bacteroidota bacterium]
MKLIRIAVFLLLLLSLSNYNWAQEKKNMIVFGSMVTRFNDIELYDLNQSFYGYYEHPAGPGIDVIYYRCLTPNTRIGSGLNWQHGRVASYLSGLRRFRFDEFGVPFVFQTGFAFCQHYRFFLTTGVFLGEIVHVSAEAQGKYEKWHVYDNFDSAEKNSNDTFFADYYLDAGFSRTIFKQNEISIAPFLKSRMNTTWLNLHEKKLMYGIKLTYSIKF